MQPPSIWQQRHDSQAAGSIIDCVELSLLTGKDTTIALVGLGLSEVPNEMSSLPELLAWYSTFEARPELSMDNVRHLDLAGNLISSKYVKEDSARVFS